MMQNVSKVELTVSTLALSGFSAEDSDRIRRNRHRISNAFEQEMQRLIEQQGVPTSWSQSLNVESVAVREFTIHPAQPVDIIGIELARAIFRGMQPQPEP